MLKTKILQLATELVDGDRDRVYGDPRSNHERIAAIWSVLLDTPVNAQQVAMCMAAVKMSRLVQTPNHLDSYVDAAAYMAIAGELATNE